MEVIIDYTMLDYLRPPTRKDAITQLIIGQCKEHGLSQSKTLPLVNAERMKNGYEQITLSAIKYLW